jgi:N-succinyldiaminopimelate aminotransferase
MGLVVHPPEGTYFATTDVSALGWEDSRAFCTGLAERAKVVAIPSQVFYEEGSQEGRHLVRWAFCKEREVLDEGLARMQGVDLSR